MSRRIHLWALAGCIGLLPAAGAAAQTLTLRDLAPSVLASDPTTLAAEQAALVAFHSYRSTIGDALPKIDLSAGYNLAYTPLVTVGGPDPLPTTDLSDRATHVATAKIGVSQLLPTAGNLTLSLEDAMTTSAVGESTTGDDTTNPDPDFRQAPKLTVGVSQPILLNGRLLDLRLFNATLRKAEIGYRREDAGRKAARNQALQTAVELYLSVVEIRGTVARRERSLELGRRRLESMEQNYRLGIVSEPELLDARIGVSTERGVLLELKATRLRTERLLAHYIGRESLGDLVLEDALPAWRLEGEAPAIREKALREHPLIGQADLTAEERRLDEVIGGQRHASTLTLGFTLAPRYPYRDAGSPARGLEDSFGDLFAEGWGQDWTVSAGLSVRIFEGGKRAQDRDAARALTSAADQSRVSRRQGVVDGIELALERRPLLEERVQLMEETVSLARSRLANEQSLLELGTSTQLDVDSRAVELETKMGDLWRAKADLVLENLDLAALTGADLAELIGGWGG